MPRTARASVGDICYHVINRGNSQIEVFHKDGDYQAFVEFDWVGLSADFDAGACVLCHAKSFSIGCVASFR